MKLSVSASMIKERAKIEQMGINLKLNIKKFNLMNDIPSVLSSLLSEIETNSGLLLANVAEMNNMVSSDISPYNNVDFNEFISDYINIDDLILKGVDCDINDSDVESVIADITDLYGDDMSSYIDSYVNNIKSSTNTIDSNVSIITELGSSKKIDTEKIKKILAIILLVLGLIYLCNRLYKNLRLLTETRFPSPKLFNISIKNLIIRLNTLISKLKTLDYGKYLNQITKLESLLDIILVSVSTYIITSEIFIHNKKKIQSNSYEDIKDYVNINSCDGFSDLVNDGDVNNSGGDDINMNDVITDMEIAKTISCDTVDGDIIPSKPFLRKIEDLTCEGNNREISEIGDTLTTDYDIVSNAKIIGVKYTGVVGDYVHALSTIDDYVLPISGTIHKINDDVLYLSDIEDVEVEVNDAVEKLTNLYTEKSQIEELVNSVYLYSLYPSMVFNAKDSTPLNLFAKRVDKSYSSCVKEFDKMREDFDKTIQNICGADNVERCANNETLVDLSNEIISNKNNLMTNISSLRQKYINLSISERRDDEDLELISYYINDIIFNFVDLDSTHADDFRKIVTEYVQKRKGKESYGNNKMLDYLKDKLSDITNKKIKISEINNMYNSDSSYDNIYEFLCNYSDNLIEIKRFVYMFYVYKQPNNKDVATMNLRTEASKESKSIENFWNNIFKRINEIDSSINNINMYLDNCEKVDYVYTICEEDNVEYRVYDANTINDTQKDICGNKSEDISSDFSPNSSTSISSIKYWIKYMGMATLTGCVPIYWSTGLILLGAPIPLPIIYTPIKAIKTQWGVIVIGLGICGIAISPMVYYVNLENKMVSIIPNVAIVALKASLNLAKKELKSKRESLKTDLLKPTIDNVKSGLLDVDKTIQSIEKRNFELIGDIPSVPQICPSDKMSIPIPNFSDLSNIKVFIDKGQYTTNFENISKIRKNEYDNCIALINKHSNDKVTYIKTIDDYYTETNIISTEYANNLLQISVLNDKKYKLETQVYNIQKKMNGIKSDTSEFSAITIAEDGISKSEKLIDTINNNIDKALLAMPIGVLSPNSVNFGPSIKKFMLVNQIDTEISNKFDGTGLSKIVDEMDIYPNDLTTTNISNQLAKNSIKKCIKSIDMVLGMLSIKDVLPKYEKLSPTNIKFLYFLSSTFCVDGAKQFGLPGYPQ